MKKKETTRDVWTSKRSLEIINSCVLILTVNNDFQIRKKRKSFFPHRDSQALKKVAHTGCAVSILEVFKTSLDKALSDVVSPQS